MRFLDGLILKMPNISSSACKPFNYQRINQITFYKVCAYFGERIIKYKAFETEREPFDDIQGDREHSRERERAWEREIQREKGMKGSCGC